MTKIPRDVHGAKFAQRLSRLGYREVRQGGSHLILQTTTDGEFSISVPLHKPMRIGTLHTLLKNIARHHKLSVEHLLATLEL